MRIVDQLPQELCVAKVGVNASDVLKAEQLQLQEHHASLQYGPT